MIQGTKIYKVVINSGKIDNHKACDYQEFYDNDEYNTASEDVQVFKEKGKALVRFNNVCLALQRGLDTMFDIQTSGDDPKTVASSIEFKLAYTQDDGLWVGVDESEYADDPEIEKLRDGRVIFKGKKAIEELIKSACLERIAIVEYFETKASVDSNEVATSRPSNAPCGWSFEQMIIEETTPTVSVEEITNIESKISLL